MKVNKLLRKLKPDAAVPTTSQQRMMLAKEAVREAKNSGLPSDIGYATTGNCLAVCIKLDHNDYTLYVCTIDEAASLIDKE